MSNYGANSTPAREAIFPVRLLRLVWHKILRVPEASLRESIEGVLDEAEGNEAQFSSEEQHMLRNLLGFRDVRVDDVMVPRADIEALDKQSTADDVLARFAACGHSRMPVFSGSLDQPLGMVHVKDVLSALHSVQRDGGNIIVLENFMHPVLFIPPSMPALDLLLKMQTTRHYMALIIDEYGGTDGLVTIEDLIEEIIGDIEDESDDGEASLLRKLDETSWRAHARLPLVELASALAIILPKGEAYSDVDTLGGLVVALSGRVPERGEMIACQLADGQRLEFIIRDGDPRRIKQIDLKLLASDNVQ